MVCVRLCVRARGSDCGSDVLLKVMRERKGVMGQQERKRVVGKKRSPGVVEGGKGGKRKR